MPCSRIIQLKHIGNIFFTAATGLSAMLTVTTSAAEDIPRLEELVITGEHLQRYLDTATASITVIDRDMIDGVQPADLAGLLESTGAVDITRKGLGQADISIRGSSAEGVLLLVDGVRAHDPQTGHFLMDTPFTVDAIERVEILHGGGSSIYGASASGGVINIVTDKSREEVNLDLCAGSFGTKSMAGSWGGSAGNTDMVLNIRSGSSDGYREGSDLRYTTASVNGRGAYSDFSLQWNAGVIDKRFGAADFYAPFPSYEETNTVTGGVNASWIAGNATMLRMRVGLRGHGDDFRLIRDDPDYYRNTHYNRSVSMAGEMLHIAEDFRIVGGVEAERDGITSGSLGNRNDTYGAVYSELTGNFKNGGVSFSLRYDNDEGGGVFSPGIGVHLSAGSYVVLRARTGRSFRRPTYTERYYLSPSNIGDPDLNPETSLTTEAGIDISVLTLTARFTAYRRSADNVIDWVRESPDNPWRSVNHGNITTSGLEMSVDMPAGAWRYGFDVSRLFQKAETRRGTQSKYALNPAELSAGISLYGPVLFGLNAAINGRHECLTVTGARFPVNVRVSKKIGHALLRVSIDNIGNERYEEMPGLHAPGRWFSAELEYLI